MPYPVVALAYMTVTLACYSVLFTYPNNGGVFAATVIAAACSLAWFPNMWPWRLQTTSRATGSAFAISFVNSLGQTGSIIGPQVFRSEYAPRYATPFGVAMGLSGVCILAMAGTWWLTWGTESRTRHLKKRRIAAAKEGRVLYEDIDVDADFGRGKKSDAAQ